MLTLAPSRAHAGFTVNPPNVVMQADVGERMAWVDVIHTSGPAMAVELLVYNRDIDVNGEPRVVDLVRNDDFTIYPAQVILQPGGRARVQIVYNSRQRVRSDKAYTLLAREVPLPIDGAAEEVRAGVNTLVQYYSVVALLTGRPGRLTFVSSRPIEGGRVEVVAENKSNGRVKIDDLAIVVGGRERITEFTGKKNSIMPGERRRFTFVYGGGGRGGRALGARDVRFDIK